MGRMSAAEQRARAVVERLPEGPVTGVEVGVHDGRMSAHLLRLHAGLTLYMVDNWLHGEAQSENYRGTGDPRAHLSAGQQAVAREQAERVTAFAAGRRYLLTADSVEAASLFIFDDASLDFAFIDADHSYEGVRADIRAWLPKVKPGGLLCGHDFGDPAFPGVQRAVCEAAERHAWTVEFGANRTWFVRVP